MSDYISLTEAKDQVSVEHADTAHDDRLNRLILAAESAACNFCNVDSMADFENSPPESPPVIPEDVKSGILMTVEFLFDRDERTEKMLTMAAERLLWPYRQQLGV